MGSPKSIRGTVRHIEAGGIGYKDGYTTLALFLALNPCSNPFIPFLDLRFHLFDNHRIAFNGGVGRRWMGRDRFYGINAYYDYRNTVHKSYNQVGMGFETLGEIWDLRLNGYIPLGQKSSHRFDVTVSQFSNHSFYIFQKFEYAMTGLDGEVGVHFFKQNDFDFYAATGAYYFHGEMKKNALGAKARLAMTFKEVLRLELSDSFDSLFHNRLQGQIGLTFQLGRKKQTQKDEGNACASIFAANLLQPVNRQEIVVLNTEKQEVPITDGNGNLLNIIFVSNTSHSAGTFESPYPTLQLAEENSAPGDIIYVLPGNGTAEGMDEGIVLQANQKLWGSGVSHTVQTSIGPITIPALSPSNPCITNSSGYAVTLANGNEVSGFSIISPHSGILGNNVKGVTLSNISISDATIAGIVLSGNLRISSAILTNLQIQSSTAPAILLTSSSTGALQIALNHSNISASNQHHAIAISASGVSSISGTIQQNSIQNGTTASNGANLKAIDSSSLSMQFLDNTFTTPSSFARKSNGGLTATNAGFQSTVCLQLQGNSSTNGYWLEEVSIPTAVVFLLSGANTGQNSFELNTNLGLSPNGVAEAQAANIGKIYTKGKINSTGSCP